MLYKNLSPRKIVSLFLWHQPLKYCIPPSDSLFIISSMKQAKVAGNVIPSLWQCHLFSIFKYAIIFTNTRQKYQQNFTLSLIGPPFAPRDLKVIRVVTKSAVLLGWQLPNIDDQDRSNGCRVMGYKVCEVI